MTVFKIKLAWLYHVGVTCNEEDPFCSLQT